MDRSEVERLLVADELHELEARMSAMCASVNELEATTAAHGVHSKVTLSEFAEMECKIEDTRKVHREAARTYRAHLAVLAVSLSTMENEEQLAPISPLPSTSAQPADLSELRNAVIALEYLLDAELGAPAPTQPITAAPDQHCAVLLDQILRPFLDPFAPEHHHASVDSGAVVFRAVRALGRRASGISSALSELTALQAILENEIQLLEAVGPLHLEAQHMAGG
jgi:hypothetical protein